MAESMELGRGVACVHVYLCVSLCIVCIWATLVIPFFLLQIPIAYLHVMEIYKSDKFWYGGVQAHTCSYIVNATTASVGAWANDFSLVWTLFFFSSSNKHLTIGHMHMVGVRLYSCSNLYVIQMI